MNTTNSTAASTDLRIVHTIYTYVTYIWICSALNLFDIFFSWFSHTQRTICFIFVVFFLLCFVLFLYPCYWILFKNDVQTETINYKCVFACAKKKKNQKNWIIFEVRIIQSSLSRERAGVRGIYTVCVLVSFAFSISFIEHTLISSLGSSFLICTTPLATFGGTTPAAPAETLASREFDGEVLADIVNWVGSNSGRDGGINRLTKCWNTRNYDGLELEYSHLSSKVSSELRSWNIRYIIHAVLESFHLSFVYIW